MKPKSIDYRSGDGSDVCEVKQPSSGQQQGRDLVIMGRLVQGFSVLETPVNLLRS